jgi:deazaflavin-dependent oxidoreductase (nitroreductase family)
LGWVPIDGQMVIVASYGGGRNHPNWYYNLLAEPNATIEVGTETRDVRARRLEGEERERLWKTATELVPGFGDYQTRADEYGRQIQIFVLEPR